MSQIALLADALYREEVARAREMKPSDKLLEGPRSFERACQLMDAGISQQHPQLDAEGRRALLTSRLARLDALDRP